MEKNKIRIVLADDQPIIIQGLKYIVNTQSDMEVVGEATDGEAVLQIASQKKPDLILMDIQMPKLSGIDATKKILALTPACKIVLLTTFDIQDYVFDGIRAGAVGYLLKDTDTNELLEGIRWAHAGQAVYRSNMAGRALAQVVDSVETINPFKKELSNPTFSIPEALTDRELEVLQLMAFGRKNTEISTILHISHGTVKSHVHRIIQKLGVEERTQAVVLAIREGIVQ